MILRKNEYSQKDFENFCKNDANNELGKTILVRPSALSFYYKQYKRTF